MDAALERVTAELEGLVAALAARPGAAVADTIAAVEAAGRLMDAARVLAVAQLARDTREAEKLGFASSTAAVATLAQVSERTARARLALAESVTPDVSVTGAVLEPRRPEIAQALTAGRLGFEGAVLINRELQKSASRVTSEEGSAAESLMVGLACGVDATGALLPPISVDYLAGHVRALGAAIDPDGARPREERAALLRDVWVGKEDEDGLFPFGGRLKPEVAIPLLRKFEAARRSPRFTAGAGAGAGAAAGAGSGSGARAGSFDDVAAIHDPRTPGQRRHDTFGEILLAAIAEDGAPLMNGRTAAVLVTVTADNLHSSDGRDSDPIGTMSGSDFPVSRREVERFIDAGGYRTVTLAPTGAVLGISSPERCFTATQAMSIAARDGERCFTPGCTTPHTALQVHHVIPWRDGGPTTTSNGILLCYWHHQLVDDGPWRYQMTNGLPEVRGPGVPEWKRPPSRFAYVA
ncbi:hypothetical protein BH11ACT5_BH11ACT5_02710 [soil metagenome]